MLILRTVVLKKKKEWWFVINGVPVRYSLREHGLISGLNCKNYPANNGRIGSMNFVSKHFKGKKAIVRKDVENKLKMMTESEDRLKMGVLYFLSSVFTTKAKVPSPIESFLLKIIDDLDQCKEYPWGRYSFEHCCEQLRYLLLNTFNGVVKDSCYFPAFVIPLEVII